ncbi:MAG TPA: hypothetical protein VMR97_03495 [Acidimicrobiales bacterium]|nr:hypothetical protein [Acidimicrobiales bacterium]
MLTITDDAATAMRLALERADVPPSSGMRISADEAPELSENGDQPMLRLDVVTDAEAHGGDELVVAPGGLQIFIEPQVAPLLEDKVLDGAVEESGRAAFRIVSQKL